MQIKLYSSLKKIFLLAAIFFLSSCAGIRYCKKDESPTTGCRPWDPAAITGAANR